MNLKPHTSAPLLCALLYLCTLAASLFLRGADFSTNTYLLVTGGVQILTYLVPLVLYGLLFGLPPVRRLRLCAPHRSSALSSFLLCLLLLLFSFTLSLLLTRVGLLQEQTGNADFSRANPYILFLVAILLPAVCEEFVFRGILLAAFESCGILAAATGASLLFAFAHMDFARLPIYFCAGMLFCAMTYVSRSLVVPVLGHIVYNAASVYLAGYIRGIALHLESFALLFILLSAAVGLLSMAVASAASRTYAAYAATGLDSAYTPQKMTAAEKLHGRVSVWFSLPFLMCVLIYIAVVILTLE